MYLLKSIQDYISFSLSFRTKTYVYISDRLLVIQYKNFILHFLLNENLFFKIVSNFFLLFVKVAKDLDTRIQKKN